MSTILVFKRNLVDLFWPVFAAATERKLGNVSSYFMKPVQKITFILILLCFVSCKRNENEDAFIFENYRFENMDKLNIKDAIENERELGSTERTENNTFALDTGYYPNKNGFRLDYPKVFERNQKELGLETDYFYSTDDGLVKVIFYQWNSKYWNLNGFESDTLKKIDVSEIKIYRNKFNNLKKGIINKLGKASKIEIEKHNDTISNYRDNYEWKRKDLNVLLSIYYSENYNEIRLVIHKK